MPTHHVMKARERVAVKFYSCLAPAVDGCERTALCPDSLESGDIACSALVLSINRTRASNRFRVPFLWLKPTGKCWNLYWKLNSSENLRNSRTTTLVEYFIIAFLGTCVTLRKATISFVLSVRPSVNLSARNNSAPTGWMSWMLMFECLLKIYREN